MKLVHQFPQYRTILPVRTIFLTKTKQFLLDMYKIAQYLNRLRVRVTKDFMKINKKVLHFIRFLDDNKIDNKNNQFLLIKINQRAI